MRHLYLFFLVFLSFACLRRDSEQARSDPATSRGASNPPRTAQSDTATLIRVLVYLRDGSQLVGSAEKPTLPLHTSYGDLDVPLTTIRSITFSDSLGASTIEFSNGDLLHGKLDLSSFAFTGTVGKLELPLGGIAKISQLSAPGAINGLVAYYPLDGSTADASGHGHDGVNHGAVPGDDRLGNPDRAYSFNGSGAYIALPDGLLDPESAGFTISLWSLARSTDGTRFIIYIGANSGEASLTMKDQQYSFVVHLSGAEGCIVSAPAELSTFVHLACVYQRGKSITLWVNGHQAAESSVPNRALYHEGSDHSSALASYAPEQPNHSRAYHLLTWDGLIDDVRIYNRALEPAEITRLSIH